MYIGLRGPARLPPSLVRQVTPIKSLCSPLGAAVRVVQAALGCPQSSSPNTAAAGCHPPWLHPLNSAASTEPLIKSLQHRAVSTCRSQHCNSAGSAV